MASSTNTEVMGSNSACGSCGHRVPITLRDLFWQDPFFSSNWDDFHKIHDEMMSEPAPFGISLMNNSNMLNLKALCHCPKMLRLLDGCFLRKELTSCDCPQYSMMKPAKTCSKSMMNNKSVSKMMIVTFK